MGRMNINDESDQKTADILNNVITFFFFVITLVDIVIHGIGMASDCNSSIVNNGTCIPIPY